MIKFLKKVRIKSKYGMFWHGVSHTFGRKGIVIYPYYLVQEVADEIDLPDFRGDIDEYTFDFMSPADLETIEEIEEFRGKKALFHERLNEGHKCLCAKHQGQIVAHSWLDLKQCRFLEPLFALNEREAYLYDMYTLKSYRGKNLAPYLRFKSYEVLKELGRDTFYSISESLNAPAVKFKKKLNAKFLGLYLWIDLFKKWKRTIRIKEYKT
jgi:hypothetical protein